MSIETPSFDANNREILENAGFGTLLLDAYDGVVALDPRLTSAEIVALPPYTGSLAMARPSSLSENGSRQVRVALGDSSIVLDRYDKSLGSIHGARKFFAERIGLGLSEQDITPTFLATHSFIHEFRHIGQYIEADASPDPLEFWREVKRDKANMPLGNIAVSTLLDPNSDERQALDANLELLLEYHGAGSLDELLGMQHTAYRLTHAERDSDMFSATVLLANPALLKAATR
jgi:hypothetical protein